MEEQQRGAQDMIPELNVSQLTDEEVFEIAKRKDNPVSNALRMYRSETAKIEQHNAQTYPTTIQLLRMELEAVVKIMRAAGLGLRMMEKE